MLQKLKSRKLWIAVAAGTLMALGTQLGLDTETLERIMAVAMTYIGGESLVDAAHARRAASQILPINDALAKLQEP